MSDTVAVLVTELRADDKTSKVLAALDAALLKSAGTADRAGRAIGGELTAGQLRAAQAAAKLTQAEGQASLSAAKTATEQQRLATALQQTVAAKARAEQAGLRLAQAQERAAKGTSSLSAQLASGLKGGLLGLVGPAAAATAAISGLVSIAGSFRDAFNFKTQLDATTDSINSQLTGVRDTSVVWAEAAQTAQKYRLTQADTNAILASSIDVLRNSTSSVTELEIALLRLQSRDPSKPIGEAARALRELQAGDVTTIKELFNIGAQDALKMKNEIQGGADAVQVLTQFLDQAGSGMNILQQRTTGAMGAMNDLALAQQELTLAQAEFAQGPGMALLEQRIRITQGATRLLTADTQAMGESWQQAGLQAQSGIGLLTGGLSSAITGILQLTGATEQEVAAIEAQTQANANAAAMEAQRHGEQSAGVAVTDASTSAFQVNTQSLIEQTQQTLESQVAAQKLSEFQELLASLGSQVANGLLTSADAAAILSGKYREASGEAGRLIGLQAQLARVTANLPASQTVTEGRAERDTPAMRAEVGANRAVEANRQLLSSLNKVGKATKSGGAARLSDQQKLDNALLAGQEKYQDQVEAATQEHTRRLMDIEKKYQEDMAAAREEFAQNQFDDRASFYDQLGGIEDEGLRKAMSAQYEAAAAEAAKIASEKGADAADEFLAASRAAIEKQAQLQQKINEARDAGDDGTAEYYEGVLRLQQQADQRRLDSLRQNGSAIAGERDRQLTDEEARYAEQQDKLAASSSAAADRKIADAVRSGKAIDVENAKLRDQQLLYDQINARKGGTPVVGAALPTGTPASTPIPIDLSALASQLQSITDAVNSAAGLITTAQDRTTRAVGALGGGKFLQ